MSVRHGMGDSTKEGAVKDSDRFLNDLRSSRVAVNEFVARVRSKGFFAWLPPERTRPDPADRKSYADSGDLMLQGRVEHKVRTNLRFTSRDDYPYQTVIVDEVYKEQAKASDPVLLYVIENSDRTHAAVVYGWTRPRWQVESRPDPIQGRVCDFYTVDKSLVRFCPVDEVL